MVSARDFGRWFITPCLVVAGKMNQNALVTLPLQGNVVSPVWASRASGRLAAAAAARADPAAGLRALPWCFAAWSPHLVLCLAILLTHLASHCSCQCQQQPAALYIVRVNERVCVCVCTFVMFFVEHWSGLSKLHPGLTS